MTIGIDPLATANHATSWLMDPIWETLQHVLTPLLTLVSSLPSPQLDVLFLQKSVSDLIVNMDIQLADALLSLFQLDTLAAKPPPFMMLIFTLSLLLTCSLMILFVRLYRHHSSLLAHINQTHTQQSDELKQQMVQLRSQLRKIITQYRIVSNNRDALQKALMGVKQDLSSEKEARFVREKYLNERVDKLEQDIDFKDQEIDDLKSEIKRFQQPAFEDEDAWILSSGEINKTIRRVSCMAQDMGLSPMKTSPHQHHHSEDEEGYVSEESCDATVDVFADAVNVVYHELISDVNICTLLNDVDDLAIKYGMTRMDCLGVCVKAILRYLQTKNLFSSVNVAEKIFQKFGGLLAKFTITEKDQVHLLEYLEIACITESAEIRVLAHLKVLMALYKMSLVEPTAVIEWHSNHYTETPRDSPTGESKTPSPSSTLSPPSPCADTLPILSLSDPSSLSPHSSIESAFAPNRLCALMAHSPDFINWDAQIKALSKTFVEWLVSSQDDDDSIRSTSSLGEEEHALEDDKSSQSSRSSRSSFMSDDSQDTRTKKKVTFNEVIQECGCEQKQGSHSPRFSDSPSDHEDDDDEEEEESDEQESDHSASDESDEDSHIRASSPPRKRMSEDEIEIVFE